ncbi:Anoctamin-3 [Nowakowskiella sp. JEL0078]|nr:Anoctamin-3 [Nowakowskiella sp. JEL0078]
MDPSAHVSLATEVLSLSVSESNARKSPTPSNTSGSSDIRKMNENKLAGKNVLVVDKGSPQVNNQSILNPGESVDSHGSTSRLAMYTSVSPKFSERERNSVAGSSASRDSFKHPEFDFELEQRNKALKDIEEEEARVDITSFLMSEEDIVKDLESTFRMGLSDEENNLVKTRALNGKLMIFHSLLQEKDLQTFDEIYNFKKSNPEKNVFDALNCFCKHQSTADAYVKIIYEEPTTHFDAILKFALTERSFSSEIQRDVREIGKSGTARQLRKNQLENEARKNIARSRFLIEILEQRFAVQIERDIRILPSNETLSATGEFFIKIIIPFEVLCQHAERIGLQIHLKKDRSIHIKSKMARGIVQIQNELQDEPKEELVHIATSANQQESNANAELKKRKSRGFSSFSSRFSTEINEEQNNLSVYKEGPPGTLIGNFGYMFANINGYLEWDSKPFQRQHLNQFLHGDCEVAVTQISMFSNSRRNMLAYICLQRLKVDRYSFNKNFAGIQELLNDKVFTTAYTLHDGPEKPDILNEHSGSTVDLVSQKEIYPNNRPFLSKNWTFKPVTFRKLMGYQPLPEIREYYGEKVAFYFAWMGMLKLHLK